MKPLSNLSKLTRTIIILLLIGGSFTWIYGWHILHHYRTVIFEAPIRFEPGFQLKRQFTVDLKSKYYFALRYRSPMSLINLSAPTPPEPFSAQFQVDAEEGTIAQGNTETDRRGKGSNLFYSTRFFDPFNAEPQKTYEVSFRISKANPDLYTKRATLFMTIDPLVMPNNFIVGSLATYLGAGLVFASLVITISHLFQLSREKKLLYGTICIVGFVLIALVIPLLLLWYSFMALILMVIFSQGRCMTTDQ